MAAGAHTVRLTGCCHSCGDTQQEGMPFKQGMVIVAVPSSGPREHPMMDLQQTCASWPHICTNKSSTSLSLPVLNEQDLCLMTLHPEGSCNPTHPRPALLTKRSSLLVLDDLAHEFHHPLPPGLALAWCPQQR
jgi:hypothetical protein